MPNTLLALRDIISSPNALVVVLGFDDALLHRCGGIAEVTSHLRARRMDNRRC